MGIENMAILDRRRIEAEVLGPMIRAFQQEFGEAKTNEIARKVIVGIAREQGRQMAEELDADDLRAFEEASEPWARGDAFDTEELEKSPNSYAYNVTRCRYAEMYKEMGIADLGFILSCNRDFSHSEGFSKKIKLTRTQTIMQGASHCDFRYARAEE